MRKHIHIVTNENFDPQIFQCVVNRTMDVLVLAGYPDPKAFVHEYRIPAEQNDAIATACYDQKAQEASVKFGYAKLSQHPVVMSVEPFMAEHKFRLACQLGIINFPGIYDDRTKECDNALLYIPYHIVTDKGYTDIFGLTSKTGGIIAAANICLTYSALSKKEKAEYVGMITMHEMGHVLGLVDSNAQNNASSSPTMLEYMHCKNPDCVMNLDYLDDIPYMLEIFNSQKPVFCSDCTTALRDYTR